jgi:hypothetical protein
MLYQISPLVILRLVEVILRRVEMILRFVILLLVEVM